MDVEVVRRGFHRDRAFDALPLPRDHFDRFVLFVDDRDFRSFEFLVPGLDHFVAGSEVEPELEPDGCCFERGGHLGVHNAFPCRHPLDIPRSDHPFMSLEILMGYFPLEHVGNCFEPTMWVVRESGWELDVEVVEHQEWIEFAEVLVAEDTDHAGSFAFVLPLWLEYHGC